jgi:hypothetical protein
VMNEGRCLSFSSTGARDRRKRTNQAVTSWIGNEIETGVNSELDPHLARNRFGC